MRDWFQARITYSAEWAKNGKEWSQVEGFQNESFLTSYLDSMGWRIVKAERICEAECYEHHTHKA